MWTFDNFPSALVRERYGVEIDEAWLERVRRGTVRLSGCTASFVSPDGLILTNHHCVASCLAQNSTRESSLLETGFVAAAARASSTAPCRSPTCSSGSRTSRPRCRTRRAASTSATANERRRQTLTELELACEDSFTNIR